MLKEEKFTRRNKKGDDDKNKEERNEGNRQDEEVGGIYKRGIRSRGRSRQVAKEKEREDDKKA